jgi:uncharacterized protein YigA (DUF484 family)
LKHLLKDTLTIYSTVTHNEYNEETFSDSHEYMGRFQLKNKLFLNDKNEQIQADALVYIEKEATGVDIGTKITFNEQDYRVVAVKSALNDLNNLHHYEVWLQRWEQ